MKKSTIRNYVSQMKHGKMDPYKVVKFNIQDLNQYQIDSICEYFKELDKPMTRSQQIKKINLKFNINLTLHAYDKIRSIFNIRKKSVTESIKKDNLISI